MNSAAPGPPENFFKRCWSGSARLWQAFWLVGVLGELLVVAVVTLGSFLVWRGPEDDALLYGIFAPVLAGYVLYASVSIWRCARNTHQAVWGVVARVVVVLVVVVWALASWQEF